MLDMICIYIDNPPCQSEVRCLALKGCALPSQLKELFVIVVVLHYCLVLFSAPISIMP